jgi:hypothetical protein
VPVEVVLVDPEEEEEHNHEQEDQIGNLEDVEGVETPNVEGYHEFELNGERSGRDLLVKALLAVFIGLLSLTQQLLSLLLVDTVPQIKNGDQQAHDRK